MPEDARRYWRSFIWHFYKPAAWANFAPAVLAVHWVRVPCLPEPSARTSPARDGFEKFEKPLAGRALSGINASNCPPIGEFVRGELLLIRQLNMANKNLGGVFDSRILEVRLDTFGFALEFA